MILLVTCSKAGAECAKILEQSLKESVVLADSLRKASSMLRNQEYSALVLDDPMVDTDAEGLETVLHGAGMAVPVYVNLAISNGPRVVREVKSALRRHEHSRQVALRAAESLLRSEIRDAVTGILLSTELALQSPELPMEAEEKMKTVSHLAAQIRERLETVQ